MTMLAMKGSAALWSPKVLRAGMGAHFALHLVEALAPAEANDIVQDLTFVAILKDYGKGADKTIPRPEGYDPAEFAAACQTAAGQPIPAEAMLNYGRLPNGKYMLNWPVNGNDVYMNIVEVPYARRDAALRPAREKTLRFIYYIQHELGFSHLGIADDEFGTADGLAYLPYHREGRRLDGVIRLTLDDVADRYGRPSALYRTGISVGDTTLGTAIANLGWDEVRFPAPVFIGDTLNIETEVFELRDGRHEVLLFKT